MCHWVIINHGMYTANAEILACRKFGDPVRNRVGLNIGEFLIWRLGHGIGQYQ